MGDVDTLQTLATRITDLASRTRTYDAYYDGEKRLAALGLALPPEMRQLQVVVNWPRLTVDALENRINFTGFRMGGADQPDERLWSWWQRNNLDEEAPLGHLESFVQGRAYVAVGFDDDNPDTPVITVESARNMTVDIDPRTRKVTAAARLYDYAPDGIARAATLYLSDRTVYLEYDQGRWRVTDTVDHQLGRVPVVPMINRARLHDRTGRSEMTDVMDLTDACCRALTNLQGAQELMAVPTRYVLGVAPEDMKDQDGKPISKWEAYLGRFNTLSDPEAKVIQLAGADLRNFTETINSYAHLVSSVTGMPASYLGQTSENPASADAIRSAEARHIARAERRARSFAGVWEEVMRLGMLLVDGEVPDDARLMEAVFADCGTPTYASRVDAVVKLWGADLIPRQGAWEELGFSAEKRRRYQAMMDDDDFTKLVRTVQDDDTRTRGAIPTDAITADGQVDGLGRVTE